jgi:hypothetical protein
MLSSARPKAAASSFNDVSGSDGQITFSPLRRNGAITLLQLDPSAQAPCTRTIVALLVNSLVFGLMFGLMFKLTFELMFELIISSFYSGKSIPESGYGIPFSGFVPFS